MYDKSETRKSQRHSQVSTVSFAEGLKKVRIMKNVTENKSSR